MDHTVLHKKIKVQLLVNIEMDMPWITDKYCYTSNAQYYELMCCIINTSVKYHNKEKLVGLKFGESANKSVWQKKVWRIHPELQVYIYGYQTHIRLICAIGE